MYLRLTPVGLQLVIPVALVADELLRPLFDDLRPDGRSERHLSL